MARLNCGVIGLGRLGFRHAQTVAGRLATTRLAAVADPVSERCARFQEQVAEVRVYPDYRDLIRAADIDAVIIASPTDTHIAVIREAVHEGKAVFCEKPLSLDVEEARAVERLVEDKNAFVQVGFMRRYDRGYSAAKRTILSGSVGTPVSIRCVSRDPAPPSLGFAKSSGGLFLDLAIHDIDLVRWFLQSEVERVYARGSLLMWKELDEAGDIDHGDILLTMTNGAVGAIEVSRNARYGYDVRTEIVCTEGTLVVGDYRYTPCMRLDHAGAHRDAMPWFLERFGDAYETELAGFAADVLGGKKPAVSVRDGITAVEIAVAAKKSNDSGRPIRMD